jgi:hypothetical protein
MPRSTKARAPGAAPPPIAPSRTTHLFSQRDSKKRPALTSERIADDLEAFHESGGHIEVLGTTRSLKKIDPEADDASAPAATAPAKSTR